MPPKCDESSVLCFLMISQSRLLYRHYTNLVQWLGLYILICSQPERRVCQSDWRMKFPSWTLRIQLLTSAYWTTLVLLVCVPDTSLHKHSYILNVDQTWALLLPNHLIQSQECCVLVCMHWMWEMSEFSVSWVGLSLITIICGWCYCRQWTQSRWILLRQNQFLASWWQVFTYLNSIIAHNNFENTIMFTISLHIQLWSEMFTSLLNADHWS